MKVLVDVPLMIQSYAKNLRAEGHSRPECLPDAVLVSEELPQHWSQSLGSYFVCLTFQRTEFCMRHRLT
jgi:hypothetical protein